MSFDHWWVGLFVDEDAHGRLERDFAAAAEKAVLSPESQQALAAWRDRPSDFEEDALILNAETAARANAFIWAFNLPGFDELAKQLLGQGGRFTELAAEEHLFRMEIAARHAPVSIVWHALGCERASLLPGRMGNLLLHPREIEDAQEKTRRAFAGTSPQELLDAAKRYCGRSVRDETLRDVIGFLPEGLMRASKLRQGFLALARPQI